MCWPITWQNPKDTGQASFHEVMRKVVMDKSPGSVELGKAWK